MTYSEIMTEDKERKRGENSKLKDQGKKKVEKVTESQKERERKKERTTYRKKGRERERKNESQTERNKGRERERKNESQTERQKERKGQRDRERKKERQTERKNDRGVQNAGNSIVQFNMTFSCERKTGRDRNSDILVFQHFSFYVAHFFLRQSAI